MARLAIILFVSIVALIVLAPLGLLALAAGTVLGLPAASACGTPGGISGVDREVAATVYQAGIELGASRRVQEAAFAAALVESGMRNLDHGDRDSLGVFQQRPSQGWGTATQIMDPYYAARQFYARAIPLDSTWTSTTGLLAQAVQRSAYPRRYDGRLADARALLDQTAGTPLPSTPERALVNGRLPEAALAPVAGAPGHRLRPDAASALSALLAAAHADRIDLRVTDSYRTHKQQVAVKAAKPGLAAVPGTSNHGWGTAIDTNATTFNSIQYAWLRINGPQYGWDHPPWAQPTGTKPEPWHWEYRDACSPSIG